MKEFLNPSGYNYLWSDYDVNFIFTSCYLFPEFKATDFVLIYDWREKKLDFYLSHKDQQRLADEAVSFYQDRFEIWQKFTKQNIQAGEKFIKLVQKESPSAANLTNQQLQKTFLKAVYFFQLLGGSYFYTEYFYLGKIEELIRRQPAHYARLKKKFDHIGKLKFKARRVLNNFYNYHKIFEPYVAEIGRRWRRTDLPWLSYEEINSLFAGERISPSNRGRSNWVLAKNNDWRLITGEKAEYLLRIFTNYFQASNLRFIKGQGAYPGNYQGTVRVIKTIFSDNVASEIKKFKKGNVLVANTTGPEIMTACQRAGAIVTDEGGLTSHAAIIARELKIPCVVGTKLATKIFKDGDLVKIDAERGIVKKI